MCKSVHNETAEMILRLLGAGVTSVCATGDGSQTVVVFEIKMIAASEILFLRVTQSLEAFSNMVKHCQHILPSLSTNECATPSNGISRDLHSSSIKELHKGTTCREVVVRSKRFPFSLVISHPHPRHIIAAFIVKRNGSHRIT